MSERKSPRVYTPEEKRLATERAAEVGAAAASKELGISSGTLSSWVFLARQASQRDTAKVAAPAAFSAQRNDPASAHQK